MDSIEKLSPELKQQIMEERKWSKHCNICIDCLAEFGHLNLAAPKSKMKYCQKCGKELPKQ